MLAALALAPSRGFPGAWSEPSGSPPTTSSGVRRLAGVRADRDRLAARDDLDLVGWQESNSRAFRQLDDRYRARGWETWSWKGPREQGPAPLAFSWRTATLELLDVDWVKVSSARRGLG